MTVYTDSDLMNPRWLREAHAKGLIGEPRWFGLGCVQIDVSPTERVNFWLPGATNEAAREEIHNHRRGHAGRVLRGLMRSEYYSVEMEEYAGYSVEEQLGWKTVPRGTHVLRAVDCSPGAESRILCLCTPVPLATAMHAPRAPYTIQGNTYHSSVAVRPSVTRLTRPEYPERLEAYVASPLKPDSDSPSGYALPEPHCLFAPLQHASPWEVVDAVLAAPTGYHTRPMPPGVLGETSKIEEELAEFLDAVRPLNRPSNPVMALVELSDMMGAVSAYLERHHPSVSMADLMTMAQATRDSFESGERT